MKFAETKIPNQSVCSKKTAIGKRKKQQEQGILAPHIFHASVRPQLKLSCRIGISSVLIITSIAVIAFLLVFGATWDTTPYFPQTKLMVAQIGSAQCAKSFVNMTLHLLGTLKRNTPFGWYLQEVDSVQDAIDLVERGATWCAVVIHANASCELDTALAQGFNASGALVQVVYDQGRQASFVDVLVGMVSSAVYNFSSGVSRLLIDAMVKQELNVSVNSASIVASPFQLRMRNLHPTLYPGLGVATTLGLIVLMIIAGSVVGSTLATFGPLMFKVPFYHMVLMRPVFAVSLSSLVALIMTTVMTLFGAPIAKGFVPLWLFLWLCMHCFLTTNAFIIMCIGPQFSGFLIAIYTFLSMSCSQFSLPIEFSPVFFKLGYALPLFHAVQGARHIIFGSYNQILMNTLILLGYTVSFTILLPTVFWGKIFLTKYQCMAKLQQSIRGTLHELEVVLKGIMSPAQKQVPATSSTSKQEPIPEEMLEQHQEQKDVDH